jgi:hypothetical protein
MRAAAASLLLLLALHGCTAPALEDSVGAGGAGEASAGAGEVALPPHTGNRSGHRPLILFHDSFFGRTFVRPEYAFEARARRGECFCAT